MKKAPKKNRSVSSDSNALGHALACSIPELRKAAINYVAGVIREGEGQTTKIPEILGVSLSAYQRWLANNPELQEAHTEAAKKRTESAARTKETKKR